MSDAGATKSTVGRVCLVGAGPGSADLITVRGARRLGEADLVLYDALASEEMRVYAPQARWFFVGKRACRQSIQQDVLNRLLIKYARRGLQVVRLKCGDPFVFGRGGEEALALTRGGVPFRIVPGVTAGIGGLAYAGIPVTHRDTNHAVTFVTGHGADGRLPKLDWAALAKGSPTLVLFMARKHAGEIAAKLIAAGRGGDEPAAIVSDATSGKQAVAVTTLGRLGEIAVRSSAPAIIVIGENVRLRDGLDWIGALAGKVLEPYPLGRARLSEAG